MSGPSPFVPAGAKFGVWLRSNSSSGGKDWAIFITDAEVLSQWGKTGQINLQKVLSTRPDLSVYNKKIGEKMAKGYWEIATWNPSSNRWDARNAAISANPVSFPPTPIARTPPPPVSTPPLEKKPPTQRKPPLLSPQPETKGDIISAWLADRSGEDEEGWF